MFIHDVVRRAGRYYIAPKTLSLIKNGGEDTYECIKTSERIVISHKPCLTSFEAYLEKHKLVLNGNWITKLPN